MRKRAITLNVDDIMLNGAARPLAYHRLSNIINRICGIFCLNAVRMKLSACQCLSASMSKLVKQYVSHRLTSNAEKREKPTKENRN